MKTSGKSLLGTCATGDVVTGTPPAAPVELPGDVSVVRGGLARVAEVVNPPPPGVAFPNAGVVSAGASPTSGGGSEPTPPGIAIGVSGLPVSDGAGSIRVMEVGGSVVKGGVAEVEEDDDDVEMGVVVAVDAVVGAVVGAAVVSAVLVVVTAGGGETTGGVVVVDSGSSRAGSVATGDGGEVVVDIATVEVSGGGAAGAVVVVMIGDGGVVVVVTGGTTVVDEGGGVNGAVVVVAADVAVVVLSPKSHCLMSLSKAGEKRNVSHRLKTISTKATTLTPIAPSIVVIAGLAQDVVKLAIITSPIMQRPHKGSAFDFRPPPYSRSRRRTLLYAVRALLELYLSVGSRADTL